jgi:hypothetical protein
MRSGVHSVWWYSNKWKQPKDSILTEHDDNATPRGKWIPTFRRNVVLSHSRVNRSTNVNWFLNIKVISSFETSESDYPVTQGHVREGNPQPHLRENLHTRTFVRHRSTHTWRYAGYVQDVEMDVVSRDNLSRIVYRHLVECWDAESGRRWKDE